jgi:hypothetical protein
MLTVIPLWRVSSCDKISLCEQNANSFTEAMESELKRIEWKTKWSLSDYNANRKTISKNSNGGRSTQVVRLLTKS